MKHHITAAAIAAVVAFGIGYLPKPTNEHKVPSEKVLPAVKESAYDRIIRTSTIRCGYMPYEPMVMKNPNTGEMSGIAVDIMNKIGENLHLKIEWTAEFGFATSVTDLQSSRFDVACIGFWRLPAEAKSLTYTLPFAYSPMYAYVREGDTRFDGSYDSINHEDVKIISADGQMSSIVATTQFPKAKLIELPNMTSSSQQFEELVSGKADVFLEEASVALAYMDRNPGKVKRINVTDPLRVYQNTIAMNMGEGNLKTMLDSALLDLIENGEIDRIIAKYDNSHQMFLKIAKGYQN